MVIEGNGRDVIEACRRGDQDAFASLFEAHRDRVYSIALRYSGDPAAAMDIAQDVFVRLLSHIQEFRGEASFETWLYRMVVNRCIDQQRRGRRWLPLVTEIFDTFRPVQETALQDLLQAEKESQVQSIIATLPPEQRMVVVLRYTEGLSYDEIAEVLACSPGTVASRLNRAHKTLGRRLSHLGGRSRE